MRAKPALSSNAHVDYLHEGHLHHAHAGHVDDCTIAVDAQHPDRCTPQHACGGHDAAHVHGPTCGHAAVPHGDHVDYLVAGHLHHAHGGHCDTTGRSRSTHRATTGTQADTDPDSSG